MPIDQSGLFLGTAPFGTIETFHQFVTIYQQCPHPPTFCHQQDQSNSKVAMTQQYAPVALSGARSTNVDGSSDTSWSGAVK